MTISNPFEICFLLVVFSLLGIVLIGNMLRALKLERYRPSLAGAIIGVATGMAVIEALPWIS
ncbi:hypothetical protein FVF58_23295 [Paraburkholderia panacisoli]|uniref:Uncharacterized protein n=1 Tax=Paraburkholderia panacisoli TaxID=2603818 RepID=A0A5B0GXN0_9BURK|nr:hypothetical protein [Paraburkholderia panacisoli]KAA1007654.1 hypothetical protein FVF58_23295 [Paraburkholderia panacisoli]